MEEQLILVSDDDEAVGVGEKISVHAAGLLHRAFSIFIFNARGELLLQRRAGGKYHSGGLWSNTCCGHPRPGEPVAAAAHRRLREEMGFDCELAEVFSFRYEARLDGGYTENEFDHVLFGRFDGEPAPDAGEVCDWEWVALKELKERIEANAGGYTYWLRLCVERVAEHQMRSK
jgi:isopentenyl-diphosphate delta-isomerase